MLDPARRGVAIAGWAGGVASAGGWGGEPDLELTGWWDGPKPGVDGEEGLSQACGRDDGKLASGRGETANAV